MQKLPTLMIDLIHQLPPVSEQCSAGRPCNYVNFGMPEVSGSLWVLRSTWLQNVVYILIGNAAHHRYFVKHVYNKAFEWVFRLMWGSSYPGQTPYAQEVGAFAQGGLDEPLLDPMPYLAMFSKLYILDSSALLDDGQSGLCATEAGTSQPVSLQTYLLSTYMPDAALSCVE